MQNLDGRRAKRLILLQAAMMVLISVAVLPFGTIPGLSALIGGFAAVLGNALFAAWVFGRYNAAEPGQLVARFYAAELLKLVVIVGVFAMAFAFFDTVNVIALFAAFLVVQVLPTLLANRLMA